MGSVVWTAFTTRDAKLPPFGEIRRFRSKKVYYCDLSISDEFLKVWGGDCRVTVIDIRLVRDSSALHCPISVWHQSTARAFWRPYNSLCFWITLVVIWCYTPIGLCRAHADRASLSTDSHLFLHAHFLSPISHPNEFASLYSWGKWSSPVHGKCGGLNGFQCSQVTAGDGFNFRYISWRFFRTWERC